MHISGHQSKILDTPIQIISAIVFGIILGLVSLLISPIKVIVIIAGVTFMLLGFKKPEFLILSIIAVLCTVYPEDKLYRFNIGFGKLYITEIIIVGLFILILIRWFTEKNYKIKRTPLNVPLLLFYLWSIAVSIIIFLDGGIEKGTLISEIRVISYYLIFFLVINLVTTKSSINILVDGFFLLSTGVAVAMIVQYIFGASIPFLYGRVETLVTEGEVYSNVTRIVDTMGEGSIISSFTTLTLTLLLMTRRWSWDLKRILGIIQWLCVGIAVMLTFSRTVWVAIAFGVTLTALLVENKDKIKFVKWAMSLVYLSPLLIAYLILQPNSSVSQLIFVSIDRFASLTDYHAYSASETSLSTFRWRDFEYRYGIPQIAEHPVTGIGLGAEYRPLVAGVNVPTYTDDWGGKTYTHNGHLWIAMKTGLVGYFLFCCFSMIFIIRSLTYWKKIPDGKFRRIMLGFAICYLTVLFGSITHPMIMTLYWTPILGMMFGINESIIHLYLSPEQQKNK